MSLIDGLYVEQIGNGLPLLCMHGGMGFDHTTLNPWLDPLAESFRLIYYDHRGNGRSAEPMNWNDVNHASWVEDAEALRVDLRLGPVVLFGHSWGGFLAQEYALRYPRNIAGLILCSTAPALDYGHLIVENARKRGSDTQFAALLAALKEPLQNDDALAAFIAAIGSLYFHEPNARLIDEVFGRIRYRAAPFNRALFTCAPLFNTLPRLHEIRAPVLLLAGADDWIMPAEEGIMRIRAEILQADVTIFERSGHFPFVEESDLFISTVSEWLAGAISS